MLAMQLYVHNPVLYNFTIIYFSTISFSLVKIYVQNKRRWKWPQIQDNIQFKSGLVMQWSVSQWAYIVSLTGVKH